MKVFIYFASFTVYSHILLMTTLQPLQYTMNQGTIQTISIGGEIVLRTIYQVLNESTSWSYDN